MPLATIKVYKHFDAVDEMVKSLAKQGLEAAAEAALGEIESIWNKGDFHTERVEPTLDGFKSGVSAAHDKKHIAHFHDHGTLGNFKRGKRTTPKQTRKIAYKLIREKADPRRPWLKVGEPTGIKAKGFYGRGRVVGKRALLRSLGI